jgi:transcriptional regulator with XRE-family HTH domain
MENTQIDLKKLGAKVRFRRQGKGWSLAELAEISKVSKAYISDLENGLAGKPNIQYIFNIAVALDATIDELLQDTTAREPRAKKKRAPEELPPGLWDLQQDLASSPETVLTDEEVEKLAQVNFRGNRPRDKEGWRFVLQAIRMAGERNPQK